MEVTNKTTEEGSEDVKEEKITLDKCLFVGKHKSAKEREREIAANNRMNAKAKADKYAGRNVYVRNLDDTVDDKMLMEAFKEYGTITSGVVMKDAEGNSKGFGFVCFSS